jgi:hypothetical protein
MILLHPPLVAEPGHHKDGTAAQNPEQANARPAPLRRHPERHGLIAEVLLYDVRRTVTLAGPTGVFVAPDLEAWLMREGTAMGAIGAVFQPELIKLMKIAATLRRDP